MEQELYSIGKLAKMVGISTDTLRHYDEIGLLKPAFTSPETSYRYYTPAQATDIARILEMKAFDFPLATIKEILQQNDKPALTNKLRQRYAALMQEKQRISNVMEHLARKLKSHEEEPTMKKTILLVDDSAFMRTMCKDILEKNDFVIIGEASNGEEAVDMYKSLNPQLVVMNITMPTMDGLEALRKIRTFDIEAYVIMLSAMGQASTVAMSLLTGARYFVVKPFQPDTLINAVNHAIEKGITNFNHETLECIIADATKQHPEVPLSQNNIDELITAAKSPAPIDIKTFLACFQSQDPRFSTQPTPDPILTALNKINEGQEKIMALLERLLEKA